ncbi:MAG TPA: hypothetical protein VJ761_11240 [Ktedonobacteraceae bacterium]|nr:hypothetical protein [Ktedonobacteraceae bacterium]
MLHIHLGRIGSERPAIAPQKSWVCSDVIAGRLCRPVQEPEKDVATALPTLRELLVRQQPNLMRRAMP